MNYIKTFKLFEAAIKPLNFDGLLEELKLNEYNNLDELNKTALKYNIEFVTFDNFYNSLGEEIEKELAPKNLEMWGGVKFGVYNKYTKKINIVVVEEKFIKFIKELTPVYKKHFYEFLDLIIQHESIHMQQVNRMKSDNVYKLDSSPEKNSEKYYSEKREIMAYAHSIVFELQKQGKRKDEILNYMRKGSISSYSRQYNHMNNILNDTDIKLLNKYIYEYINMLYDK